MKAHVGVDLQQRFCYLTAADASGKISRQAQVANDAKALRAWLRKLPAPRQVVVEASEFRPAFARAAGLRIRDRTRCAGSSYVHRG